MIKRILDIIVARVTHWLLHEPDPAEQSGETVRSFSRTFRVVIGWMLFVLGIFLFWLPLPLGIPFMLLGAALIGRRDRTMRRIGVMVKLFLRRWARLPLPVIGPTGRRLLSMQRDVSRELRRWRWRQTKVK